MLSNSFLQHYPQVLTLRRRPFLNRFRPIPFSLSIRCFLHVSLSFWADVVAVSRRKGLGNDRTVCAQRNAGNAVK